MPEVYAEPSVRTLQFFVRDEPGALAKALAVFRVSTTIRPVP